MRPRQVCRGKPPRAPPLAEKGGSFNEAPASLPGKGANRRFRSAGRRCASMRPRQVCRGKPGAARRRRRPPLRFNEAPASLPGKAAGDFVLSDQTLGFNEAPASLPGKGQDRGGPRRPHRAASMRPRQVCRGKLPILFALEGGDTPASMRPRQVCRGKRRCRPLTASVMGGFNEAPASLPGKGDRRSSRCRPRPSFNEAPASLPGKVARMVDSMREGGPLQ